MKLNFKFVLLFILAAPGFAFRLPAQSEDPDSDAVASQQASGEVTEAMYKKFADARKAKNVKAAQEAAGEILSRNPDDLKTLNALAVLAIDQGKYDLAHMFLSKVFKSDPNNPSAHNNAGVIFLKSDDLRMALVEFKKTLEDRKSVG